MDTTFYTRLGGILRGQRKAAGLSLKEVAAGVGVSWQQLQRYETGRSALPVDRLQALCGVLRLSPAVLLDMVAQPATKSFTSRAAALLPLIEGADRQHATLTLLEHMTHRPVWRF